MSTAETAVAGDQETRLAVGARAGLLDVSAFSSDADVLVGGMSLNLEHGLSDAFSFGGSATYLTRFDAPLRGAMMENLGGEGFTLYTNVHDVEVVGTAKLFADRWLSTRLVRWHPFIGIRGGAAMRILSAPQLFNDRGAPVGTQEGGLSIFPVLGLEGGVAYRLSRSVEIGASFQATYSGDDRRSMTSSIDVAWLFF